MNTSTEHNHEAPGGDDAVARLVRLAGRRPVPSPEVREQVYAAAEVAWRRKVQSRRQRRFAFALAATIAGLAVVAGWLSSRTGSLQEPPPAVARAEVVSGDVLFRLPGEADWKPIAGEGAELTEGAELETRADSGAAFRLAGGESLRINADTTARFEGTGRLRLLAGAVYLDSGAREAGPSRIDILTPAGTVHHLGTQYEILYRDGDLRLRIREGRVVLERDSGDLRAQAGDEVVVDADGRVTLSTIERHGVQWAWVQALAVLPDADERSLESLLEWVARETGRDVHFARPSLRRKASRTMLHGDARGMAPMEALATMLQTTDFQYTVTGDDEILIDGRSYP